MVVSLPCGMFTAVPDGVLNSTPKLPVVLLMKVQDLVMFATMMVWVESSVPVRIWIASIMACDVFGGFEPPADRSVVPPAIDRDAEPAMARSNTGKMERSQLSPHVLLLFPVP
jgi:hypothetical protein